MFLAERRRNPVDWRSRLQAGAEDKPDTGYRGFRLEMTAFHCHGHTRPGNSRTAACTQLSRSRSPSRRSALGAKPEAADLEQGFRSAPISAIRAAALDRPNSDINPRFFLQNRAVIPPASRPDAGRRGKWLRTKPGSWEHNQRRASCERCLYKSPHPRSGEPRRVQRRHVRSRS